MFQERNIMFQLQRLTALSFRILTKQIIGDDMKVAGAIDFGDTVYR